MQSRSALLRLAAAVLPCTLALALSACAPAEEPAEEISVHQEPIKGGFPAPDDTSTVGLFDASIGGTCSGSLIAPNVVLTARHCVSNTPSSIACGNAKPGALHTAGNIYVTTRATFTQNGDDYHTVREVIGLPLDPESDDPLLQKEDLCGRDMAIVLLDDNIDPSEAVPLVPRVDSSLVAGEEYYAVGFGATNDSGGGAGTRRRRDDLFVDCVSDDCPSLYVKASEWIGDTGICQGDSGGPAIDMQNRVVGVTSRGSAGCETPIYGHVLGWGQWVKDVVLYAAQPAIGNYPPPGWASGKSTDPAFGGAVGVPCTDAQCTSHICINTGTDLGEYCSHKCDAINTCPEGFECSAELGLCTHVPPPEPEPEPDEDNENNTQQAGGCGVARLDPTKPIPWRSGILFFAGVAGALALRRRSTKSPPPARRAKPTPT